MGAAWWFPAPIPTVRFIICIWIHIYLKMHSPEKTKGSRKSFDRQMARHMLTYFLVWFISKKPVHGYDIIKTLEGEEGFRIIAASQLYPLLKDLTKKGLIAQEKEMHGKRARKTYHVTEKGLQSIEHAKKYMHMRPLKRQFLKEMVE